MKFLDKSHVKLTGAAAAGALLLSSCGGGGGDVERLEVAINPSAQFAPMFYGMEEGIFEEHGLELEIVPQTDIAAIIAGLSSGTYDFGFATVSHVVMANADDGVPIRAVTTVEGQLSEDDEGTTIVASEQSGISDMSEVEGARVATVGLTSNNTITTMALVDEAGSDPDAVEFVQLPYGQMEAALENGDVDVAILQQPFAANAVEAGGVVLGYNNAEYYADASVTLMNTTQNYIDENPDLVEAFSDAMVASIEAANEDPDEASQALVEGIDITEEQAMEAHWNRGGEPYLTPDGLETAQELLITYGELSEDQARDVDDLVWPGALEY